MGKKTDSSTPPLVKHIPGTALVVTYIYCCTRLCTKLMLPKGENKNKIRPGMQKLNTALPRRYIIVDKQRTLSSMLDKPIGNKEINVDFLGTNKYWPMTVTLKYEDLFTVQKSKRTFGPSGAYNTTPSTCTKRHSRKGDIPDVIYN